MWGVGEGTWGEKEEGMLETSEVCKNYDLHLVGDQ